MKDKILEIINNHSRVHNGMFVIIGGKGKLAEDLEELFQDELKVVLKDKQKIIEKIAERSIKFLYEGLSTCPADNCDYTKIDCEKLCNMKGREIDGDCHLCWKDYFEDDSKFFDKSY